MTTNNNPNPHNKKRPYQDPTGDTLRQQWQNSMRKLETREAEFADRRQSHLARAEFQTQKIGGLIAHREGEYFSDREAIRAALEVCKQDLDSAHKTASSHLGKIGLQYVPGETTERDVLRVPLIQQGEAARMLNLKHGTGIKEGAKGLIHWMLTIACCVVCVVSFMGALNVSLRHPVLYPFQFAAAVILGVAATMSAGHFIEKLWRQVGTIVGHGRPSNESSASKATATLWTALVIGFFLCLDGYGLTRLNMARASFNPLYELSLPIAMLIAGGVNFSYVLGGAYRAFGLGYQGAASTQIDGLIRKDELEKQEARKSKVLVQAALDSLSQVQIVEKRLATYESELRRKEAEFSSALNGLMNSIPDSTIRLTPEEERELQELEERVIIAKDRYDAHVSSRSVNFAVAEFQEER